MTTAITSGIAGTGASRICGIRSSCGMYEKRSAHPSGFLRPISLGDRIFARLVLRGKTLVEFMINSVGDLTELLGVLRSHCRGTRGLARLYLRNMSRGWSLERPMMLYDGTRGVRRASQDYIVRDCRDPYSDSQGSLCLP